MFLNILKYKIKTIYSKYSCLQSHSPWQTISIPRSPHVACDCLIQRTSEPHVLHYNKMKCWETNTSQRRVQWVSVSLLMKNTLLWTTTMKWTLEETLTSHMMHSPLVYCQTMHTSTLVLSSIIELLELLSVSVGVLSFYQRVGVLDYAEKSTMSGRDHFLINVQY